MGSFYTVVITSMGITYRWAWIMDSLNLHLSWEADQLLSGKYLHKFLFFPLSLSISQKYIYNYTIMPHFFSLPFEMNEHFPFLFSTTPTNLKQQQKNKMCIYEGKKKPNFFTY